MKTFKTISSLLLASLAGLLLVSLAQARSNDASKKTVRVSLNTKSAVVGTKVTVSGKQLPRRRKVVIKARGKLLTTTKTDRHGTFKHKVKVPVAVNGLLKFRVYIAKKRYTVSLTITAGRLSMPVQLTDPISTISPETTAASTAASPSSSSTVTSATSDPVLVTAGDIACAPGDTGNSCQQAATADVVRTISPSAIAILGDNQYETGSLSAYQDSFAQSWGTLAAPIYPVPGNHEYLTASAAGYFSYFGSSAGDPTKGYYSYDLGQWHLIALNSNSSCSTIACNEGSAQEQWLRADLAAHSNSCTLAYWHHPRFSSGNHGNNSSVAALWQALAAYDADVVLNGHDHDYERFAPQTPAGVADATNGIREFVVGTGGKNTTSPSTPQPNSEVFQNTDFGVLKLTLKAASYDWQFVPATGGSFSDSGTTNCH